MEPLIVSLINNPAVSGSATAGLVFIFILFGTQMQEVKKRLSKVEDEYVTCKFCNMQHQNMTKRFDSLEETLNKVYMFLTNRN